MGKDKVDPAEQRRREKVLAQREKTADYYKKSGFSDSAKRAQDEVDRIKRQWGL